MLGGARGTVRRAPDRWPAGASHRIRWLLPLVVAIPFLLVAPGALGVTPIVHRAPFGSALVQATKTLVTSGCHRLSDVTPRFHRATGVAVWDARGAASSCPKIFPGGSSLDEASAQVVLSIAIPIRTFSGAAVHTTVVVGWNISAMANISTALGGTCPTPTLNRTTGDGSSFCELAAYASVALEVSVYDETNGSSYYPGTTPTGFQLFNDTTNTTYCASFSCSSFNDTSGSRGFSFAGAIADTVRIDGTFDHRHQYVVLSTLTLLVESLVQGLTGHNRATAALDLASPGLGATLSGITVY